MEVTWRKQMSDISVTNKNTSESKTLPFQIMRWIKEDREEEPQRPAVYRREVLKHATEAPSTVIQDTAPIIELKDAEIGEFPEVKEHRDPALEQESVEVDTRGLALDKTTNPVAAAVEVAQGLTEQEPDSIGAGAAGTDGIKPDNYDMAAKGVEHGSEGMDTATGAPETVTGQYSM